MAGRATALPKRPGLVSNTRKETSITIEFCYRGIRTCGGLTFERSVQLIKLNPPFRRATQHDADVLAQLVNAAGEGLAEYIWIKIAQSDPGPDKPDPWDIGRQRQAKMALEGKIIVLEADKEPVAALTGYPIAPDPEPIPADMPQMFKPLQELENAAPDTWYVNVLAALPQHRGKGYGSKLLKLAEEIADNNNLSGLSLIVADKNLRARKLYESCGFVEKSRKPIIRDNWDTDSREWVLLTKTFSQND